MNVNAAVSRKLTQLAIVVSLSFAPILGGCAKESADAAARAEADQELQRLKETNQELRRLQAENQELPRLRRDNEELGRLREQTKDLDQLREENTQLRGQLQAAKPGKRP